MKLINNQSEFMYEIHTSYKLIRPTHRGLLVSVLITGMFVITPP